MTIMTMEMVKKEMVETKKERNKRRTGTKKGDKIDKTRV